MSGGPFRDTLPPLIADARRELARLRQQRTVLDARYERARASLDKKIAETPPPPNVDHWPLDRTVKKAFIAGASVGLVLWFPILMGRR